MELNFKIQYRWELNKLLDFYSLPKRIAEIGVAEGRFSKEIYGWDVAELYLVDIWEKMPFIEGCGSFENEWHNENYRQVRELFKDKDNVCILKGFSHKMAEIIEDGHLSMVYIDGDHTYSGVKADISYWWPKLCSGGIMAFHDYMNGSYGVQRAVTEHMQGESNIHIIEEDGNHENMGAWVQKL